MKAYLLTVEQVLESNGRDYNPQIWEENVKRMLKYKDVKFYIAKGYENGYDYDRYFVQYTIEEGIRFFKPFGYSAMISSSPFAVVYIQRIFDDGKTESDLVNELVENKITPEQFADITNYEKPYQFQIERRGIRLADGSEGFINRSPEARIWMAERSKYGMTFTSDGF